MNAHVCYVDHGGLEILCFCTTGKDHDEYDFENPDAPDWPGTKP